MLRLRNDGCDHVPVSVCCICEIWTLIGPIRPNQVGGAMRWRAVTSLLAGTVLVTAAACGSTTAGTFHPRGASLPKTSTPPSAASPSGADGLTWPPFGADVHIVMPSWLPGSASQDQAVIAAKD